MNEEFYKILFDNLYDGIYCVDNTKKVTYWNKSAEEITGYSKEEVIGYKCSDNILRHIDEMGRELCLVGCPLSETIKDGNFREAQVYLHHKNGNRVPVSVRILPIHDNDGKINGAVEIFSHNNCSINILTEVEQLKKVANFDILTNIGNRRFGEETLEKHLFELKKYNVPFGILFIDINNFKQINDTFGHNIGDKALIVITNTLKAIFRSSDSVFRWGGDEFVIILPNIKKEILEELSKRIYKFIENSWFILNNQKIIITASIGCAIANKDDNIQTLINRADEQMYQIKNSAK